MQLLHVFALRYFKPFSHAPEVFVMTHKYVAGMRTRGGDYWIGCCFRHHVTQSCQLVTTAFQEVPHEFRNILIREKRMLITVPV